MCRIDDLDERSAVHNEKQTRARKAHACSECARQIAPGETYLRLRSLFDGSWSSFAICAHCTVAQAWLVRECGGYIYTQVHEEIVEHFQEYDRPAQRTLRFWLGRVATGMKRGWRRRDGQLMSVPALVSA